MNLSPYSMETLYLLFCQFYELLSYLLLQDTNAKSPCDLFNYQCRHHGISPDFHYEVSGAPPIHTCRLNVADVVVSGQGTTKKAAKHIAVAQFLRTLILRGTHEDWGLPKNQTDAFALM
ncbi:hypothetical protein D918_05282 [Trichuris suis]|nr:hypothetical protein D918_05282 [Trichuris suis]